MAFDAEDECVTGWHRMALAGQLSLFKLSLVAFSSSVENWLVSGCSIVVIPGTRSVPLYSRYLPVDKLT